MDDAETSSEPPGRSPGTPVEVDLIDDTGALRDVGTLRAAVDRAMAHLGCTGSLRIRVVDDDAMSEAHLRWSGIEGTTDVLTFDLGTDGRDLDVDLLVCRDQAQRQADSRGHEAWREVLLYIIHGALHCLGHDDHDPADADRMHQIEDDTLEAIGVGRTYVAQASQGEHTP